MLLTNESEQHLIIPNELSPILLETSKWTKFLSIMGFLLTGFVLLCCLVFTIVLMFVPVGSIENFSSELGFLLVGVYTLMGLAYFLPSLYLYRFSEKLKRAIQSKDQDALKEVFINQKMLFKFLGIFTICMICLYILMMIVTFVISVLQA